MRCRSSLLGTFHPFHIDPDLVLIIHPVIRSSLCCFMCAFYFLLDQRSMDPTLRESFQSHSQKTKRKAWMRKTKMSMGRPCVGRVGRTMHRMNSGSVATYVRSGSMVSVWRLPLQELSILSSTSVHPAAAATREPVLDVAGKYGFSL